MTGVFMEIVSGDVVESAVKDHLQRWLPTYLSAIADEHDDIERGDIALPKSWTNSPRFDFTLEGKLPAILILAGGLLAPPLKRGDGSFQATWAIGIGVIVEAAGDPSGEAAGTLARRYVAALRSIIVQKPSLGDSHVEGVTWEDEGYDDMDPAGRASRAAGRVVFAVTYNHVVNDRGGPDEPTEDESTYPGDPPEPGPTVEEGKVSVTLTKEPIS